jgi:hypothetical protein
LVACCVPLHYHLLDVVADIVLRVACVYGLLLSSCGAAMLRFRAPFIRSRLAAVLGREPVVLCCGARFLYGARHWLMQNLRIAMPLFCGECAGLLNSRAVAVSLFLCWVALLPLSCCLPRGVS